MHKAKTLKALMGRNLPSIKFVTVRRTLVYTALRTLCSVLCTPVAGSVPWLVKSGVTSAVTATQ